MLQAVAAEEPFERSIAPDSVLGVVSDGEGAQLGLDERGGVERLLVAGARRRLASAAAAVTRKPKRVPVEPALVAEPAQRVESKLGQSRPAERIAADEECLRQPRVVVAELVLEPAPVLRAGALVGPGELLDEPFEPPRARRLEPVGVEAGEAEHGIGGRAQGNVIAERADETIEEVPRRSHDGGYPCRGEDVPERPDRASHMVANVRFVQPATVVTLTLRRHRRFRRQHVKECEPAVEFDVQTCSSPRSASASETTASRATSSTQ